MISNLLKNRITRIAMTSILLMAGLVLFGLFNEKPTKAAINPLLNFTGKVTDTGGTAVTDGVYNFSFGLYTTATSGTAIWSENLTAANMFSGTISGVSAGVASVTYTYNADSNDTTLRVGQYLTNATTGEYELITDYDTTNNTVSVATTSAWSAAETINNRPRTEGGVVNIDMGAVSDLSGVNFNQTLYLEVTFNSETMQPRKVIVPAAAAFNADKLDGYDASDFANAAANTVVTGEWSFNNILSIATSSASTAFTVTQSGAGDIVNFFDGLTEVFTITDGGNVGIGTSTPYAKLSVWGGTGNLLELVNTASTTVLAVNTDGDLTITGTTTMGALVYPNYDGITNQVLTTDGAGNIVWSSTAAATPHNILSAQHTDTTPAAIVRGDLMTVQGASPTWSRLALGASGHILYSDGTDAVWAATSSLGLLGSSTVGNLAVNYLPKWTGTVFNNSLIYDDGTNVGIGTASPNNTIQVANLINFNNTDINTSLGYQSGKNVASGAQYNTYIGYQAGYSDAVSTNAADDNTAIGYQPLYSNITGNSNIGIGSSALYFNTIGNDNIAMGNYTLLYNTTGNKNTAIGNYALLSNQTGSANTVFGMEAGYGLPLNSFASSTLVGYRAGYGLTTGSNNILLGYQAGDNLTTGASNIIIGYNIDAPLASSANTLNIGNLLFGTGIDGTGTTLSSGNIGIGTTTPYSKLSVWGSGNLLELVDTASTTVFAVDVSGNITNATWAGNIIGAAYGGTGVNSSGWTEGIAQIINGTWSASTSLSTKYGGTGQDFSASTGFMYLSNGIASASSTIYIGNTDLIAGTGLTLTSNTLNLDEFTMGTTDTNATAGSVFFAGTSGVLQQDNANFFWDDTSNRLGIGTSTPATALTVVSTAGAQLRLNYDYGNYADFAVDSSGELTISGSGASGSLLTIGDASANDAGIVFDGNAQDYYAALDDTDDGFKIGLGSTIGSSAYLTILSSGNIGIGTSTPYSKLSVWGSGNLLELIDTASTTVFAVDASGNITNATWTGNIIGAAYGGTGADSSGWTEGIAQIINGTWSASTSLSTKYGGTGQDFSASTGFMYLSNGIASASSTIYIGNTDLIAGTGLTLTSNTLNLDEFTMGTTDTNATAGSVFFAGTSGVLQQDNLNFFWDDTNNRLGIGTASPQQKLHVEGQCVTGDTKLLIQNLKIKNQNDNSKFKNNEYEEIEIKDVKGGEYVLSLNEKTGKIVPAKIKGLLDMGVKPIYKLSTESGRSIRTTGNHPYLTRQGWVKVADIIERIAKFGENVEIAVPNKKSALEADSSSIAYDTVVQDCQLNNSIADNKFLSSNTANNNGQCANNQKTVDGTGVEPVDSWLANPNRYHTPPTAFSLYQEAAGEATDIMWDKIVQIEFTGYEQVYDIEVEGTHNFVANGIIAHNTYISGNTGIGTTTPYSKLTVWGSGNLLELVNTASTTVLAVDSSGNITNATWAGNIIGVGYGGTGVNSSGWTEGIAQIINGTWSASTSLSTKYGGTGQDFSASTGFMYLSNGIASASSTIYIGNTDLIAGTGLTLTSNTLDLDEFTMGTTDTNATAGSVFFAGASGVLQQDNLNFFWDDTNNRLGIGTSTPQAALHIGSASSTNLTTYGDSVFISGELEVAETIYLGPMEFGADSGVISWIDMPITSSASINTAESYSARLDGTDLLTIYAESDGAGGIQYAGVGIGSSTPFGVLSVQASSTRPALFVTQVDSGNQGPIAVFYDGGTEKMRLDSSGYLGIGTSSPAQKLATDGLLYVGGTGTSTIENNLHILGTLQVGSGSTYITSNGINFTGDASITSAGSLTLTQAANSNFTVNLSGAGDFIVNANQLYVDTATGNIGIGTTTPNWNLQIASSTKTFLALSDMSAGTDDKHWFLSSMGGNFYIGTSTDALNATSTYLTINNKGSLNVDNNTLYVDAINNRIGINKSSPSYGLDISGSISADDGNGDLRISGAGGVQATWKGAGLYVNSQIAYLSSDSGKPVALYPGGSEKFRVQSSGLVGIGTTSPYSKLSVWGGGTGTGQLFELVDSASSTKMIVLDDGTVNIGTTSPIYDALVNIERTLETSHDDGKALSVMITTNSQDAADIIMGVHGDVELRGDTAVDHAIGLAGGVNVLTGLNANSTSTIHAVRGKAFGQPIDIGKSVNGVSARAWHTGTTISTTGGVTYGGHFQAGAESSYGRVVGVYGEVVSGGAANDKWAGYFTGGNVYASDKLSVGTTSNDVILHIIGNAGEGALPSISNATNFILQNNIAVGTSNSLTMVAGTTGINSINFGDADDEDAGRLVYNNSLDAISLFTNASEALRIDSSGNIGIGTTTPYSKLSVWGSGTSGLTAFNVVNSASSTLFAVLDNGYVGIGTAAPDQLLDVYKTAEASTAETLAEFMVSDDSTAKLQVYNGAAANGVFGPTLRGIGGANGMALGTIAIASADTGTTPVTIFDSRMSASGLTTRPLFDFREYGTSLMLINATGKVGIGTTSPYAKLSVVDTAAGNDTDVFVISTSTSGTIFKVDGAGNVHYDGTASSPSADYAEYFWTEDTDLQSGEVVCVDVTRDNAVKRCETAADGNVMGIVSTKPAIVGNAGVIPPRLARLAEAPAKRANPPCEGGQCPLAKGGNPNYVIVGLLGQVPAKVSTENGEIRPGDSLTPASIPGYVMRADAGDSTVGVALEAFDGTNGIIPPNPPYEGGQSPPNPPYEGGQSPPNPPYEGGQLGVINVLISRRNKSLTVETVEEKITERIAAMEIEDEVNILIANAINSLNIDEEIAGVLDPKLFLLTTQLTATTDNLTGRIENIEEAIFNIQYSIFNQLSLLFGGQAIFNDKLLEITNNQDTITKQISIINNQLAKLPALSTSTAFYITKDGNLKMGNAIATTTPQVAIVEIGADSDKPAFVVNQQGDGDVADFRAKDISIVNIGESGKVTIVGELAVDGRIMVCSGGTCGAALDGAVDETMGDMGVEGTIVAGAFAGYCEDGFVWVPGSAKYGTMPGFCIQARAARLNTNEHEFENELTRITNADYPIWTDVSQGEAALACQALGDNYHLLSENEWLTIAENILRVSENDVDLEIEGMQLATTTDRINPPNPPYEGGQLGTNYILTNGNVIYDLVGEIAEWTDQTVTKQGIFEPVSDEWQEYYDITDYKGFKSAPPYYYTSANGIGRVKTGDNENNLRGFVRGFDGVFSLDLSNSPATATSTVGFRCAK